MKTHPLLENEYQNLIQSTLRPGKRSSWMISNLPGMLYGKVLRSPHPHARILRIDTNRAAAASGSQSDYYGRRYNQNQILPSSNHPE